MFLTEQLGVGGAEALIEAVCVFFPASCLLTARLKVAPVHPEPCRLPCVWKGAKGVMGTPGWGCERGLGTSAAPWSECRGWPRGHQCCCARRRGLSGMWAWFAILFSLLSALVFDVGVVKAGACRAASALLAGGPSAPPALLEGQHGRHPSPGCQASRLGCCLCC